MTEINEEQLFQFLYHNLLMQGYTPDEDQLRVIMNLYYDYFSIVSNQQPFH